MLFDLWLTFVKIGAFAFGGGYAVLPLITAYVVENKAWLTVQGLTDLVSLSQMTPGPIAINAATFIGTKVAGLPGAVIATLGNVTPQFCLMMLLGYFLFTSHRKLTALDDILKGLKPAIVGLVAIAAMQMIRSSLWTAEGAIEGLGVIGFGLGLVLYGTKKLDVIRLVVLAAAVGLALHAMGFTGVI
ncbi:MAG: chromate transporter [Peptoniphilaceae bacterium]|nr:chromate transporter [Peptoniphilaceae bacterium]MDY6085676.1 chromate transporter [Peptoniphilaceae bacterium]